MKFSSPNITESEINAVSEALRQGHLATGVMVKQFEDSFRERFGYAHAVACNSGTSALMMALAVLNVGPGDEVIVPAYSIMATANCVLAMKAKVVFCDVDRETYNLDPKLLPDLLTKNTKVILPASIFGVPCDVQGIRIYAPGIPIVEDSIEALGSTRQGRAIGKDVEIATFGFYPNKQITTCQGGMLVTEDPQLSEALIRLRQHGYGASGDLWSQGYGWNVRLPDPLAAMGTVQLRRLDELQAQLTRVADLYDAHLEKFKVQKCRGGDTATRFIYGLELPSTVEKRAFSTRMELAGVPVRPYFNAMHTVQHVYDPEVSMPVSELIGSRTVALPFHSELTKSDVEEVVYAFYRSISE